MQGHHRLQGPVRRIRFVFGLFAIAQLFSTVFISAFES